MKMFYRCIVRHDDGSPPEIYLLGGSMDMQPVYDDRAKRGNLDPIGSAWGTTHEIWLECHWFALKIAPIFSDDVAEVRRTWDSLFLDFLQPNKV